MAVFGLTSSFPGTSRIFFAIYCELVFQDLKRVSEKKVFSIEDRWDLSCCNRQSVKSVKNKRNYKIRGPMVTVTNVVIQTAFFQELTGNQP